jgi:osmoprotectant transport system ATP-binding protein
MERPVIQFDNACHTLEGRRLLGPVTLAVTRGETVVFVGESGSGKTTALRLINRLSEVSPGEVRVEGRNVADWDPVRLRRRIGYVIQEIGLFPHMTVARNIAMVPYLEGWDESRLNKRTDELLELVGLDSSEFRGRFPHELSGGQRQRVGVARALAADPPILLCDEAFGAVDPVTRAALQTQFSKLTRTLGKTVVFVTHDVREGIALADRIVVLEGGLVSFVGTVDQFHSDQSSAVRALRELA